MGEDDIIQRYLAPLARGYPGALGLQDDCALITPEPGTELVLKTDPVAEGVHYLPGDAPEDVAWKALAVNVSDLAAKAATPLAYLMALSFPSLPPAEWLARFTSGLRQAQEAFGCHLIGGDTDRRPGPASITVTVIGSVPAGTMVRRATARPGHALFVSGTLGDAALGLSLRRDAALRTAWRLSGDDASALEQRYLRPQPRLGLAAPLRRHAAAAMDLSDGLMKDLGRMCRAGRCGARVLASDLPVSAAAARALAAEPKLIAAIAAGGDDYEVLAAVPADRASDFVAEAAAAGVPVCRIGAMVDGDGARLLGADGKAIELASAGWDHFG